MRYEYKILPAPTKGQKAKGLKAPEARFAKTLEECLNEQAAEGWEYQRAETLPSQERSGLTSTTTEWRNVLVFRRLANAASQPDDTDLLPSPAVAATPALAATIEGDDTALQADAPASITPEDGAPVKEEPAEVATPPAFLSDTPAKEGSEASSPGKTDEDEDKSKP
ncbi:MULTISPECIES: DUF4177 domain-containing protein [Sulfitobacter]|uniref:DUF4177 domain-containing protein n=1 Tax=Sulfitobacter dubius TaxID=218673 RepID=A0ABY3ZIB9_9RHOB|nr:DUF4177 domain-containing protein [Sulfitobacter dubius]UOA14326.1 hypothetical protein DSM109990_01127 [Sulfitobacter dubius]WOI30184.1 DUF4177 domain-containing protein [Sulfitobacter dubius]